jgi:hypothetical protein
VRKTTCVTRRTVWSAATCSDQHTPQPRARQRWRALGFSRVRSEPEAARHRRHRHRRHPAEAAAAAAAGSYGATVAAAVTEGAHIAAVAPTVPPRQGSRVSVVLDAVVMRHGVDRGVAFTAMMVRHTRVDRALHSVMRSAAVPDGCRGPVGHAAVMVYVMMQAVSSTAHIAAAATSRKTVTCHVFQGTARPCSQAGTFLSQCRRLSRRRRCNGAVRNQPPSWAPRRDSGNAIAALQGRRPVPTAVYLGYTRTRRGPVPHPPSI